jgi:flagellar motor switch protein FliM
MELLTPDKIAELVEAAKHGQLPEPGAGGSQRRQHRMRTVDFSRPTKFSADHQRRIVRAIETFCQTAVTRLSSELRVPVELEVLNSVQLTWADAQNQLPPGSLMTFVELSPIGTKLVLTVEHNFVLASLECLLGGIPDRLPRDRRLSEIDWSLTRRMVDSLISPMSAVWQELGGVTLKAGEIDPHDAGQVASVSEPTFTVLVECRMGKQSFALGLLVPWVSIEAIEREISGHEAERAEDCAETEPVRRAMTQVPVALRAEVAAIHMPVQEILALGPGSVINFGTPADDGVMLYAENTKLARAQPGSNGTRRAVQISGAEQARS